jgi:hypothetical protein
VVSALACAAPYEIAPTNNETTNGIAHVGITIPFSDITYISLLVNS